MDLIERVYEFAKEVKLPFGARDVSRALNANMGTCSSYLGLLARHGVVIILRKEGRRSLYDFKNDIGIAELRKKLQEADHARYERKKEYYAERDKKRYEEKMSSHWLKETDLDKAMQLLDAGINKSVLRILNKLVK